MFRKKSKNIIISSKKQFIYNLFSNFGNSIVNIIVSFVSVPVALAYLGDELYGVWTILLSLSTYISISGLGVDTATVLLMTKNPHVDTKICILKKGVTILAISSFLMLSIFLLLNYFAPDWYKIIGKMDECNYPTTKVSAFIFLIGIIINLPLSAASNSIAAFGKAYIGSLIGSLQNILFFIVLIITVKFRLSLPVYVFYYSFVSIVCNLIKLFIVLYVIKMSKTICLNDTSSLKSFDDSFRSIFRMGINLSMYGTSILLIPSISNMIISNNINVKTLVPYNFSYRLYVLAAGLIQNITVSLSPILGSKFGEGDWEWISYTYKKLFYIFVYCSAFGILGVVWFSKPFITIWAHSSEKYAGDYISIILAIYFMMMMLSHINHVFINSFNYTDKVWIISWIDGTVFLISSSFLISRIGVVSIPFGLCLGSLLISSWSYPLFVYRRSEKRLIYDFKFLGKILLVFAGSLCIYIFVSSNTTTFWGSFFYGIIGMAISSLILTLLIYRKKGDKFIMIWEDL